MKRTTIGMGGALLLWGLGGISSGDPARAQESGWERFGAVGVGGNVASTREGGVNERFDLAYPDAKLETVLDYIAFHAPGRPNIIIRAVSQAEAMDLQQLRVRAMFAGVTWETALDVLAERYQFVVDKSRLGDGIVFFDRVPRVTEVFLGVRLQDAVTAIASRGRANIVFSPDVSADAPVTLSFTDVPWRAALDSLLKAHKCTVLEEDGGRILRIATIAEADVQYEVVTRPLRFIRPGGSLYLAGVVKDNKGDFITKRGESGGANTLGKGSLLEALELIKTPSLPQQPNTGGRVTYEAGTNTLVICDTPVKIQQMLRLVDQIDHAPDQVHIKTRILTKRSETKTNTGVKWSNNNGAGLGGEIGMSLFNAGITRNAASGVGNAFQFGRLDFTGLTAVLQWAESEDNIDISQSPEILVLNNEEASVFIGSVKRYILTKVNSTSGSDNTQTETEERELLVGVQLMVIPHICAGTDQIILEILPREEEEPEMREYPIPGGNGDKIEIPSDSFTKYAHTTMMLRSGETGIIAGLIHDQKVNKQSGVPVLSRLPGIRHAFNGREKTYARAQTSILVTPTIVPSSHDEDFRLNIDRVRDEVAGFEERPAFRPAQAFPQAGHRVGTVNGRGATAAVPCP